MALESPEDYGAWLEAVAARFRDGGDALPRHPATLMAELLTMLRSTPLPPDEHVTYVDRLARILSFIASDVGDGAVFIMYAALKCPELLDPVVKGESVVVFFILRVIEDAVHHALQVDGPDFDTVARDNIDRVRSLLRTVCTAKHREALTADALAKYLRAFAAAETGGRRGRPEAEVELLNQLGFPVTTESMKKLKKRWGWR